MSTVKELINALSKLPQDAIVEVLEEQRRGYNTYTEYYPVDSEYIRVFDYTSDSDKSSLLYGKIFVQLEAK